ncbi:metallophosphoesterase 1-like [Watersipora subatra]|uniref:metallophosphoesterase 1-like n=1 Tax=Watersipora subatra TaxID=2589382 RepID=UPI00355BA34D
MGSFVRRRLKQITAIILTTLLYNEFLVYYMVLSQCSWPTSPYETTDEVRAMFIADTHLLGPTGHWWDRLRREWQMQRAFQTSLQLHNPEIVFILGDLFDDGKWSSDAAFKEDVRRFHKMFHHSESVRLVSIIGNHDIGFHYMISPHRRERFVNAVNSSDSVRLLRHKDIIFVTVNSMAFEGDDCNMCSQARRDLSLISTELTCAKNSWKDDVCRKYKKQNSYVQPILLQHFPMYRESDSACTGPDSTPDDIKRVPFREGFDCLSKLASQQLTDAVNPRLIISGHTHFFCMHHRENGVEEWSVPSFSWRNIKNPSFLMASLTKDSHSINKCFMPDENTVYTVYITVIGSLLTYIFITILRHKMHGRRRKAS